MDIPVCLAAARRVLEVEAQTISGLAARLDASFAEAVDLIYACNGRVVVAGMGKSGLIGQKVSATLSSTGTPSYFLHPAEALHGDLGRLVKNDVLLALSTSGETDELLRLLDTVKRLAIPLITMTGNPTSTLGAASRVVIDASVPREACPLGLAPTASTTAMLALGDALAMALAEKRGFSAEEYADLHPAGVLGLKLRRVEAIMHTGGAIPRVGPSTLLPGVIYEMSRKGLGHALVAGEDDRLIGFISDGDLRRFFQREGSRALDRTAADCMTVAPITIGRKELASEALAVMESRKVTVLPVVGCGMLIEGVLHIHDVLGG
ncbi:MAG: KpsF/GutQ family sugar-phosphate isomerase [Acidobacteriota bacterium]|nr:KpsF/GutQ family sugar-phosphate isomerase [Acidobacteriota bacterium]